MSVALLGARDPNEFIAMRTVRVQLYAPIRGRTVVDGELVAARCKLATCRGRCNNSNARMISVIVLVNVTKNSQPDSAGCRQSSQCLVAVVQAYRVQPLAAHRDRRVMQANHDIWRIRCRDGLVNSIEFCVAYGAAGMLIDTTINTDDEPVLQLNGLTIMKRRGLQRSLHQRPNIVVSRNTMDGNPELPEHAAKMLVRARTVVLNQIARDDRYVGLPVAVLIMREHC